MSSTLGDTLHALYRQFGELPGIHVELHKELIAVRVENDNASATVFLQGAQLSHYQRHSEPPIIWNSPLCDYRSGTSLRGGIPVCWPWFGALEKNPDAVQKQMQYVAASAHGLVRHQPWQLEEIQQPSSGQTQLTLSLLLENNQHPIWPTATLLTMEIGVGATLTINFTVNNRSNKTVHFSSALHSYFAISDIDHISLDGLDGLKYIDCLQNWSTQQQQGTLMINQEVDRIYHGTGTNTNSTCKNHQPITLVDKGWQRAITVACTGSDSAVIWNPWIEKSRRLAHFAEDAYKAMLCIESANADQDFVQLAPSAQHTLALTIGSRPLN